MVLNDGAPAPAIPPPPARAQAPAPTPSGPPTLPEPPAYALGDKVATRAAYGAALAALGNADTRIVALDADVSNSTFSQDFEAAHADRFYETYIAEQVMAGMAMGLASRGAIPFPSTFAAFLMRAADFIRMAGIGRMNITFAGSHAGVSIGQDGPSQMALEDLAMMRAVPGCAVLYPSDAVSAARLVEAAAGYDGMTYIRTTRPATPVIYRPDEPFPIGGSKVVRESPDDAATVVAAGITLFEALKAHDLLAAEGIALRVIDAYSVQPIDRATLLAAAHQTGNRLITVEDHYAAGGLGDAVSEAVAPDGIAVDRLAVREVPEAALLPISWIATGSPPAVSPPPSAGRLPPPVPRSRSPSHGAPAPDRHPVLVCRPPDRHPVLVRRPPDRIPYWCAGLQAGIRHCRCAIVLRAGAS